MKTGREKLRELRELQATGLREMYQQAVMNESVRRTLAREQCAPALREFWEQDVQTMMKRLIDLDRRRLLADTED